jgi:hypothetical protein
VGIQSAFSLDPAATSMTVSWVSSWVNRNPPSVVSWAPTRTTTSSTRFDITTSTVNTRTPPGPPGLPGQPHRIRRDQRHQHQQFQGWDQEPGSDQQRFGQHRLQRGRRQHHGPVAAQLPMDRPASRRNRVSPMPTSLDVAGHLGIATMRADTVVGEPGDHGAVVCSVNSSTTCPA